MHERLAAVAVTTVLAFSGCQAETATSPPEHNPATVPDRLDPPCPETPPAGVSQSTVATYEAQAERTEMVLPKLDAVAASLYTQLQAEFNNDSSYSKLEQKRLLAPLEFFINNQQTNTERNLGKQRLAEICQLGQSATELAYSLPAAKDGPEYVACDYGYEDNTGFNDLSQRPLYDALMTACELNILSGEDRLTVYGQFMRAVPDTALAQGNPYDTYAELMHESYVWLELETQVRAAQLDLLDVLSNGELEAAVKKGRSTDKIAKVIIRSLEAPASELAEFRDTAKLGQAYFDHKKNSSKFEQAVAKQLKAAGSPVVNVSPNGTIRPHSGN